MWEWALSVPGLQLRHDGCAQMRLEGADHRGSLSALAVGLHFWGEKGQKGAVAQPARRVWLCVLGVTAGGTGIGITHVVLWGCSMGHPQLTKGRDPITFTPLLLGLRASWALWSVWSLEKRKSGSIVWAVLSRLKS